MLELDQLPSRALCGKIHVRQDYSGYGIISQVLVVSSEGRVTLRNCLGGRGDGSAFKGTDCSIRGLEFNSQKPHGGSQLSVMESDALPDMQVNMQIKYIYLKKRMKLPKLTNLCKCAS